MVCGCVWLCIAIVTCGGLCPGLNNVIRELVHCLHYQYGANNVWGIRYVSYLYNFVTMHFVSFDEFELLFDI